MPTRSTRSRPVGSSRPAADSSSRRSAAQSRGPLPAVGGGEQHAVAQHPGHLRRDLVQVAALEHDLRQRGVQGIDPGQLRTGVVGGYQDLRLLPLIVGTTSHRQTVTRTASVGKVVAHAVAASASRRVWQRLRDCPDGQVPILHRARHAVYLDVGGRCVGVVGSGAVAVPCALRLASRDLGALTCGSAAVEDGVLHLDGTPVPIRRLLDVAVPKRQLDGNATRRRSENCS